MLEGDGGSKRFAPGIPEQFSGQSAVVGWTVAHDATTVNGNSGSALFTLEVNTPGQVRLAGLHYGGDWGGARVNWAHLLGALGDATGYGTATHFSEFCAQQGIRI